MARTLKLVAPPGYRAVSPLDRQKHAGFGLPQPADYRWARELNALYLGAAEFMKAGLDYPIAFVRDERSGEFMPMAILGLRSRQNLFVDAGGSWRSEAYVPAYARRFPFCIAEVPAAPRSSDAPQRLICVQQDQLVAGSPQPLFTVNGEPTPAWEPIQQLLEAIEGSRQQTRVLTRRLEALGLLVPFDAVAMPRKGDRLRLQGLHRVDEERLLQVPGRDLRTMMRKGELRAVYAHLNSLENFGRLLDLAQRSNPDSA
jgi:hypothetical protein